MMEKHDASPYTGFAGVPPESRDFAAREKIAIAKVEMLRGRKSAIVDLRDRNGTLRRSVHINAGKSISHRKITERAIAYANTQSEAFEYVPAWDMSYQWTLGEVAEVA